MSPLSKTRRPRPPLDEAALYDVAIRYVGKYATTRSKLRSYLARKLDERGWGGQREPDLEALANRFAELGYVDDAAFALSKSRALAGRGYGRKRLVQQLFQAGVAEEDCRDAVEAADANSLAAALRFAKRRRIGPFAPHRTDRHEHERAIAAMVRAGHDLGLARTIAELEPDPDADLVNLCESLRAKTA